MGTQSLSLKWNSHQRNLVDVFEQLLWNEDLVDVTLACEGITLKAHKTLLSACSPFFHSLFLEHPCKHPVIIMKDVKYTDLKSIIQFMYKGEITVPQDRLTEFLKTAETLKVKGLTESPDHQSEEFVQQENVSSHPHISSQTLNPVTSETHIDLNYSSQKRRKRTRASCGASTIDLSDDEHQSHNKDACYHTNTDNSKPAIECNSSDLSQERTSFPQNLHEDVISILPKDPSLNFEVPVADSRSNIVMSNILENHHRKENVQMLSSPELHSHEIEPSNSESLNLPTISAASLDTETPISRTISQASQKDVKLASLLPFQELPSTYEAGSSHSDNNNFRSIKVETNPNLNTYAECEQPSEEDHSQELCSSVTRCVNATNCSFMENPSETKQAHNFKTDLQNINVHSRKFDLDQSVVGKVNKTLKTYHVQHENKETVQRNSIYNCSVCHKIFSYNSQLISHLMAHSSERPYNCDQCEKAFKYHRNLKTHQRIQHNIK